MEGKIDNKGFSMVELIIAIAIMAILVGVLAPSVLGQVEKARRSKAIHSADAILSTAQFAVVTAFAEKIDSYEDLMTYDKGDYKAGYLTNQDVDDYCNVAGFDDLTFYNMTAGQYIASQVYDCVDSSPEGIDLKYAFAFSDTGRLIYFQCIIGNYRMWKGGPMLQYEFAPAGEELLEWN